MPDPITRRTFLGRTASMMAALPLTLPVAAAPAKKDGPLPPHLEAYRELYSQDPRAASLAWFKEARFGLFIHYGLYALLGRGEWVMLKEKIPVAKYAKLKDQFSAEKFDADAITGLAAAAGMKYVNITSRHHDSFSLFDTKETNFNSVQSPAKRDLIGEMAEACHKRRLGLFLYYSYAADWRHPYFYPREAGWKNARPAYDTPDPAYRWEKEEDFQIYLEFVHRQLRELLTQYGPLAGIWFDPIMGFYSRPDLFPIGKTYALVRSIQPHCLISFKQGANGEEDFAAPERKAGALGRGGELAARVWEKNKGKPIEICDTLQPHAWGYNKADDGQHRTPGEARKMLDDARQRHANLLLNIGPLPEGAVHPEDVATLTAIGEG